MDIGYYNALIFNFYSFTLIKIEIFYARTYHKIYIRKYSNIQIFKYELHEI